MVWIENTLWCDGCGAEIIGAAVVFENKYYCCEQCRDGQECDHGAQQELADEQRETPSSQPFWPTT
ncbi:MAG: hypothetical protein ABSA51_01560 [Anaerolineaceae bacterium]